MKPLIELSFEQYESLLRYASETSPLYTTLKNSVKTESNTIAMLCDEDGAHMLRKVAKHFCPKAVPPIEKAIRSAQFQPSSNRSMLLRDHPLMTYKGNRSWPPPGYGQAVTIPPTHRAKSASLRPYYVPRFSLMTDVF